MLLIKTEGEMYRNEGLGMGLYWLHQRVNRKNLPLCLNGCVRGGFVD